MGEPQPNIDNVKPKRLNNDNVATIAEKLRAQLLEEISEYKLGIIQSFLFGGPSKLFGDCGEFVIQGVKQAERFTYVWMTELNEENRKTILHYWLGYPEDTRLRDYSQYLDSPFWKYVSGLFKVARDFTCENCGRLLCPTQLVVHHRSYEHLGSELSHPEDMAVLCRDCHAEVHKKGGK